MGKLPVAKTKKDCTKLGTKVKRESSSSVKKNVCRGYRKRLTMLRRRISVLLDGQQLTRSALNSEARQEHLLKIEQQDLLICFILTLWIQLCMRLAHVKCCRVFHKNGTSFKNEKDSWEANNRELIDKFNTEKKLNAELQKDVFNWQRLYHEAIISQNTYKVKHAETVQNVSSCLKEIKSAFPHLVGLSETICRNQIRLTNLLNSSPTFETETHLPRAFGDGRQSSNDLSKKSEKRMKHKVGPMVNGVLIQKPTIRLERVMLHQPQDQESTNNHLTPERGSALTPIVEETEQETNLHLEQISMRQMRKQCRLGKGERWRLRKQQEMLEKERQMERERENQLRSVTESSDSEDQLGPVIRLQRVSGLLLSPNLLEVDRGRTSEGKGAASRSSEPENRRLRAGEDPKEGCSWMHLNPVLSKKSSEKRKPESSATSDSSDEESSLNVVAGGKVRSSLSDSLYKNKTFTMKRKPSSSSSAADTSRDASDSSKVEPDSTNNIDDVVFARASLARDSLGTNTSTVPSDTTVEERRTVSNGRTSSGATPLASADPALSSQDQTRSSSFCNNCTPITSPDVRGKRIRKPKIHLYPGEESKNSAVSTVLVSTVKKGKAATSSSSSKDRHSRSSAGRMTIGKRLSKNSLEPALSADNTEQQSSKGRPNGSPQKNKIGRPKKSSMKNSVEIPRTSVDLHMSQDHEESDRRNSRRQRGPISYKEPPVNISMKNSVEIPRTSVDLHMSQDHEESDRRNSRRQRGPISYKEPPVNMKMRRLK